MEILFGFGSFGDCGGNGFGDPNLRRTGLEVLSLFLLNQVWIRVSGMVWSRLECLKSLGSDRFGF